MSARPALRNALDLVGEATLAQHLRISIATLRRYANGEMRMNWVMCARIASLPAVQVRPVEASIREHRRVSTRPARPVRRKMRRGAVA